MGASDNMKMGRMFLSCRRAGDDTLVVGNGSMQAAIAALSAVGLGNEVTVVEDPEWGGATFMWTTWRALGAFENDTGPAVDKAEEDGDN